MPDGLAGRTPLLTIVSPGGDRDRAAIDAFPFSIGRQAGNNLVLRDNRISRTHARLVRHGTHVLIEDCESKLGLFVNGDRVASGRTLVAGDVISFGSDDCYLLTF